MKEKQENSADNPTAPNEKALTFLPRLEALCEIYKKNQPIQSLETDALLFGRLMSLIREHDAWFISANKTEGETNLIKRIDTLLMNMIDAHIQKTMDKVMLDKTFKENNTPIFVPRFLQDIEPLIDGLNKPANCIKESGLFLKSQLRLSLFSKIYSCIDRYKKSNNSIPQYNKDWETIWSVENIPENRRYVLLDLLYKVLKNSIDRWLNIQNIIVPDIVDWKYALRERSVMYSNLFKLLSWGVECYCLLNSTGNNDDAIYKHVNLHFVQQLTRGDLYNDKVYSTLRIFAYLNQNKLLTIILEKKLKDLNLDNFLINVLTKNFVNSQNYALQNTDLINDFFPSHYLELNEISSFMNTYLDNLYNGEFASDVMSNVRLNGIFNSLQKRVSFTALCLLLKSDHTDIDSFSNQRFNRTVHEILLDHKFTYQFYSTIYDVNYKLFDAQTHYAYINLLIYLWKDLIVKHYENTNSPEFILQHFQGIYDFIIPYLEFLNMKNFYLNIGAKNIQDLDEGCGSHLSKLADIFLKMNRLLKEENNPNDKITWVNCQLLRIIKLIGEKLIDFHNIIDCESNIIIDISFSKICDSSEIFSTIKIDQLKKPLSALIFLDLLRNDVIKLTKDETFNKEMTEMVIVSYSLINTFIRRTIFIDKSEKMLTAAEVKLSFTLEEITKLLLSLYDFYCEKCHKHDRDVRVYKTNNMIHVFSMATSKKHLKNKAKYAQYAGDTNFDQEKGLTEDTINGLLDDISLEKKKDKNTKKTNHIKNKTNTIASSSNVSLETNEPSWCNTIEIQDLLNLKRSYDLAANIHNFQNETIFTTIKRTKFVHLFDIYNKEANELNDETALYKLNLLAALYYLKRTSNAISTYRNLRSDYYDDEIKCWLLIKKNTKPLQDQNNYKKNDFMERSCIVFDSIKQQCDLAYDYLGKAIDLSRDTALTIKPENTQITIDKIKALLQVLDGIIVKTIDLYYDDLLAIKELISGCKLYFVKPNQIPGRKIGWYYFERDSDNNITALLHFVKNERISRLEGFHSLVQWLDDRTVTGSSIQLSIKQIKTLICADNYGHNPYNYVTDQSIKSLPATEELKEQTIRRKMYELIERAKDYTKRLKSSESQQEPKLPPVEYIQPNPDGAITTAVKPRYPLVFDKPFSYLFPLSFVKNNAVEDTIIDESNTLYSQLNIDKKRNVLSKCLFLGDLFRLEMDANDESQNRLIVYKEAQNHYQQILNIVFFNGKHSRMRVNGHSFNDDNSLHLQTVIPIFDAQCSLTYEDSFEQNNKPTFFYTLALNGMAEIYIIRAKLFENEKRFHLVRAITLFDQILTILSIDGSDSNQKQMDDSIKITAQLGKARALQHGGKISEALAIYIDLIETVTAFNTEEQCSQLDMLWTNIIYCFNHSREVFKNLKNTQIILVMQCAYKLRDMDALPPLSFKSLLPEFCEQFQAVLHSPTSPNQFSFFEHGSNLLGVNTTGL